MNNKQKTIITIYVFISFLIGIFLIFMGISHFSSLPPENNSGNLSNYTLGAIFSYIIGILILAIPVAKIYKVSGEKDNTKNTLVYTVLGIVIVCIVVTLGIMGNYDIGQPQSNQEIISKGNNIYYFTKGSFSAYFPEQPTFQKGSDNASYQSEYYLNDSTGAVKFEAIYASSPYKKNATMDENLNNLGVYAGDVSGFTVTSSKAITYNGLPGIDYISYNESRKYYGVGREIVKDDNLYMVEYFYPKGGEDRQLENIFLNSLTVDDSSNTNGQVSNNSSAPQTQTTPAETPSQQQSPPQPQKKDLPSIIAEWSPSVALVVCKYSDGSADFGSGFLHSNNVGIAVFTNAHVFTEETTGNTATSCSVEIPGDGNNYYTINNTYTTGGPFEIGTMEIGDL